MSTEGEKELLRQQLRLRYGEKWDTVALYAWQLFEAAQQEDAKVSYKEILGVCDLAYELVKLEEKQ